VGLGALRPVIGIVSAAVTIIVLTACTKTEVTEADSAKVKEEFSQENYEAAMKAAGKEKELEEEKKRNAAHLQGGQPEGQN
jgi:hypothetical protein